MADGPTLMKTQTLSQSVAVTRMDTNVRNVIPSCHQETYHTFLDTMATSTLLARVKPEEDDRSDSQDEVANLAGNPETSGAIPAQFAPSFRVCR